MATLCRDAGRVRCGTAVAVLLIGAPKDRPGRDRMATAALKAATGSPSIQVGRRPSGRPCLEPPHCELGVSMSARDDLLLAGCDLERPVGVDLELAGTLQADEACRLARDHFPAEEADRISALPPGVAGDVFLCHWVAKEAALKLTGRGVFDGLLWPRVSISRVPSPGAVAMLDVAGAAGSDRLRLAIARLPVGDNRHAIVGLCVVMS